MKALSLIKMKACKGRVPNNVQVRILIGKCIPHAAKQLRR